MPFGPKGHRVPGKVGSSRLYDKNNSNHEEPNHGLIENP